jgi:hypothetical protein
MVRQFDLTHTGVMRRSEVLMRAAGVAVRLVLVPLVGLALITWWLVGDVSEPGGEDVIVRFEAAERNATTLGLLGLLAAVAWAVDWVTSWHRSIAWQAASWLTAAGIGAGFLTGAGLRVVTARVGGANIGGGMVILASPPAFLTLLVITVVLSLRIARRPHP